MKITIRTEIHNKKEDHCILGIKINGFEYASGIRNETLKHPKEIINLFIIPALKEYSKKFNQ